jgi:hypothetical protein
MLGSGSATGFGVTDFDELGRTDSDRQAVDCSYAKVDALLARLNRAMLASNFLEMRRGMGLTAEDMFLTNGLYLHGSAGHWYVFHRGGRWEPQLNIGMYGTALDRPRYLRVGLGFNLTLASHDPNRKAGQRQAKALFGNLRWLACSSKKTLLLNALSAGRPCAEYAGIDGKGPPQTSNGMVEWLGRRVVRDAPQWVFVGQAVSPDIPEEAENAGRLGELVIAVSSIFKRWLPVWEAILRGVE